MTNSINVIDDYLDNLPDERKLILIKLRQTILSNLPIGFVETISYGMIGYVVPHSIYPNGYHSNPKQPLPFINIASQKNFIALYHMGIYASPHLLTWFANEYPNHCTTRLDMGKSCIRFKKINQIPFDLIGELVSKISVREWIDIYENKIKRI